MKIPIKYTSFFALLVLLGVLSILLALLTGSASLSLEDFLQSLFSSENVIHQQIIWELRWPRVLAAFTTGALLALAGALMQVLLRNPLADPYVLGVSGGAAVGALIAMLLGLSAWGIHSITFLGSLGSILLLLVIAHGLGSWTPTRLLLTGVVLASGWGALISFILSIAPQPALPGMLFWLMGDLSTPPPVWPGLVVLSFGLATCLPLGRTLNVLARGTLPAAALGVSVKPLQIGLFILSSLLTATAVSMAGAIGFIGLVVPHLLRLLIGNDQRFLLPASVLLGGALLLNADTLARQIIAPQQLPVGVMTALLGVPVFLLLLYRSR